LNVPAALRETATTQPRAWRPVLLIALFGAAWAFVETTIGGRVLGHYDLLQIVWSRYAVHLLIVIAIWGRRDLLGLWRTSRPAFHLARSIMMLIMPWSFAAALISGIPVSETWLLFWSSPLLMLVLGQLFGGESPAGWSWVATTLAWAGVALMVGHAFPTPPGSLSVSLPLLMAISFAIYVWMTRELRNEPLRVNMAYTATGVFAILSLRMPFVWVTPSPHDAMLFFGIGAFGLLALLALDRAVAATPVWIIAPGLMFQPVAGAVLGMVESGRRSDYRVAGGMLLVCACLLLSAFVTARRQAVTT